MRFVLLSCSVCFFAGLAHAQASQPAPPEAPGPASQPASQPSANLDNAPASQPAPAPSIDDAPAAVPVPAPVPVGDEAPVEDSVLNLLRSAPVSASAGGYADSPGPADSANVLPSGAGLFAFALALSSTPDDTLLLRAARIDAPQLRLRFGVFDVAEATGDLVYTVDGSAGGAVNARVALLAVGGRVKLLEEEDLWPAAALAVQFGLPLSTLELRHSAMFARVMTGKTFAERLTITANGMFSYEGLVERYAFGGALAASVYVGAGVSFFGAMDGMLDLGLRGNVSAYGGGSYDVGDFLRLDLTVSSELWPNLGTWGVRPGATVFFDGL